MSANRFGDTLNSWEEDSYESLPPEIKLGRQVLQDWFLAMEDGSVTNRQPDPFYPTAFTDEQVNEVIRKIDLSFNYEKWLVGPGRYDAGPDFYRLEPPQRLALVQQLHSVMKSYTSSTTRWPHLYTIQESYD